MAIQIARTLGPLGAEVGGVEVSRTLDDAALVSFSSSFGRLEKAPIAEKAVGVVHVPRLPEVTVVSNVVEGGVPLGALGDGELSWHSDMTYLPTPPPASILYGVEVPPAGADTWFNNMYLAYETLPAALKQRVQGLRSNHTSSYTSAGTLRKGFEDVTDVTSAPGTLHPLVIEHPNSHRKAPYLGRRQHGYIDNAGELNGFLKPVDRLFENPLPFDDGCIVMPKGYAPRIDRTALKRFSVRSERFPARSIH